MKSSLSTETGLVCCMARADVLVVDDDQAIRAIVADLLRQEGYAVYEAPDGRAWPWSGYGPIQRG